MVENTLAPPGNADDLDLMALLEKLLFFFRTYGRMIVLFSLAGTIAGYILYKSRPSQYASTMLVHSVHLANPEVANIIEDWNMLLKQHEYAVLGSRLNCSPAMLKKVVSLTTLEIQKLFLPNNPNGFIIKAVVKDNRVLDSLGDGIVYGFENNLYVKQRLDSKKADLALLIARIKIEIAKLDSTKEKINNSVTTNKPYAPSFVLDISTINGQVIGLQEKLLNYQEELRFTNAIQVFHSFERYDKPVAPSLLKSVAIGFIAGFAIGYILAFVSYMRKRLALRMRMLPNA